MSFVFFDTETTGLSRHFDQIVHFAAIRTDHQLNEIERFEVRSRLSAHVIPHPSALWVNGIRISELLDPLLPSHYEMASAIRAKLLAWSPSIFCGFNSIRFDEELLRQAFFKTLHPLYLTSMHNNGRADVLNLAMAAVAISAESLVVPVTDTGHRTFKLSGLTGANGIEHSKAHDAMSDVQAILALCRLIHLRVPQAWQSFVRFSKKATTIDFVEGEDAFLLTEHFSGDAYHTPVVCIGRDPNDPNKRLCLTLNAQTPSLMAASDTELLVALSQRPSPIRSVKVNAGPSLTPLFDVEDLEFDLCSADLGLLAQAVKANNALCQRLIELHQRLASPWPIALNVEQRIYECFIPPEDEALLQRFHNVEWQERAGLLLRLRDQRLKILGLRLINEEAPHALDATQKREVERQLTERVRDETGPLATDQAVAETEELMRKYAAEDVSNLAEYRDYLVDLHTKEARRCPKPGLAS